MFASLRRLARAFRDALADEETAGEIARQLIQPAPLEGPR